MQRGSDRSIDAHIEGAVSGQIAVGENIVQTGDVNGDVVLSVALAELPAPQPHPSPVVVRPRPFAGLLDRQEEMREAGQALQAEQPIGLCAEEGMGKSALLRRIAYLSEADAFPDGVVYISALHLQEADLRQELFNAFYECKVPTKPTDAQIQHALQGKRALILLDDVAMSREEAEALMSMAPQCTFLLASEERLLWGEGCSMPLHGLPPEAALALVVRELGRPLSADELPQARAICEALQGHPLRIIQAAAAVREEKRSFAVLAVAARSPAPAQALAASLVEALSEPQHRVLLALTALDGAPTSAAHVAAISENEDAAADLEALQRLNVVQEHGLQYRPTGVPAAALAEAPEVAPWVARALDHFASWGERLRGSPRAIMGEIAAIVMLINRGAAMEQWGDVLRLVRVAEGPLTLAGRWQAWDTVLQQGLAAARALGDRAAAAWALHQAGVRALSLGDTGRAQDLLRQSLDIRHSLGDQDGAALSRQNLDIASGAEAPPAAAPPEAAVSGAAAVKAVALKVLAVLLVLGGGGYALFRAWSPPKLIDLQVRPAVVDGGGFSALTIILDKPAPAGGVTVTLTRSHEAVQLPERATIPEGSRRTSLLISTRPVEASMMVTIMARRGESSPARATGLEVRPVAARVQFSLTLDRPTVTGGNRVRGTVELSKPAADEGLAAVQTSQASIVRAPTSVMVPAGAARVSFNLDTRAVTRATPVTVIVSYAGISKSAELRLQPRPAQLAAISFDRTTVTAGEQVGGVVTLSGAAPEGGAVVSLSPSSSAVRVDSSVTVPEGKTSARFVATAARVSERGTVRVTASLSGSQSRGATLAIEPEGPPLAALVIRPAEVVGGEPARGVVRLAGPAPRDITVRLSSSTAAAAPPETVTITRGDREAGFALQTRPDGRPVEAVITARYGSFRKSGRLRLLPAGVTLAGLSLERATVFGGETVTGTVTLSGRAPREVVVGLATNQAAATVPPRVTVPARASRAQFAVRTAEVEESVSVRVTATWGAVSKSAPLTVRAVSARLETIVARPVEVRSGAHIGVMVRLDRAVPEAVEVPLSSNRREVTVPKTVTIERGSREGTVAAATKARETVTATISASYGGVTKSAQVRVIGVRPRAALAGLSLDPTTVQAGGTASGTVMLSDPAPDDMVIGLSANSRAVTLPNQVTVRGGRQSARFRVETDRRVPRSLSVTITAAQGTITKTATLMVEKPEVPVALAGLTVKPDRVQGGTAATGTVTLSGNAPGDVTIDLSVDSRIVGIPEQVTVRAGTRSRGFAVETGRVTGAQTVTIRASWGSVRKSASLTVMPPPPPQVSLTGFGLSSELERGVQCLTATVTLSGPAPPGGATIALSCEEGDLEVSSVTVPAGQTQAALRFIAPDISGESRPVTFTAEYRGVTRKASVVVLSVG